jgi:hypothetical protein
LVPSDELAIVFPLADALTAIHKDPFQKAAAAAEVEKGDVREVQVIKFGEVLIWPEEPKATHNSFPNAMCVAIVNGTVTIQ